MIEPALISKTRKTLVGKSLFVFIYSVNTDIHFFQRLEQ